MVNDNNDSKKPKIQKKPRKHTPLKVSHIIILIMILFIVIGFTTIGTVIAAAFVDLPDLDEDKVISYNVTSYILDKDGEFVDKLLDNTNQITVHYEEISPNMVNALIAIEDKRYKRHNGVDPIRIAGAAAANMRAGTTVQGGSTITQQLAGLAMLDRSEKTYKRKIQEAILAMRIENIYSKDDIITAYLNRAYFGIGLSGKSDYGVEAAANDFFAKKATDLTVDEAALLAGMIQNPTSWSPLNNPEDAVSRRNTVLAAMLDNRYITQEEFSQYSQAPLNINSITVDTSPKTQSFNQTYIDSVVEEATQILGLEKNPQQLFSGGYYIHTSLDQELQSFMYNYFNTDAYFPGYGIQAAMAVMEAKTGNVVGIIGGRHQDETQDRLLNRAIHSERQPGSSIKPITVYGPAFEQGYGTGSVFLDSPYKDDMGHIIKNADLLYRGNTTIRNAIIDSYNTFAVRVIETIGIDTGVEFAKNLGITTLVEEGAVSDMNLSTALGGLTYGVTVLEMTGAFGAFANDGVYTKPHFITKITNENGKVLWQKEPPSHRAMNPETAYMVTSCLESAVKYGTGVYAAIADGRPTAGKTGTTDSAKDIWFCGYSTDLVGSVWIGYDTPSPLYTSSDIPARVFSNIMTYAHRNHAISEFVRPEGIVEAYIDTKTGNLATQSTPFGFRATELYKSGTEPTNYSANDGFYSNYIKVDDGTKRNQTNQQQWQAPATTTPTTTTPEPEPEPEPQAPAPTPTPPATTPPANNTGGTGNTTETPPVSGEKNTGTDNAAA